MQTHAPDQESVGLIRSVGIAYFVIAFLARMPYAMIVVGVLTLVVSGRGSLTLGGLTSAMVGIGVALVGPLLGAAADRFGQRRVVLGAGVVNSVALLAMAWVVPSAASDAVVLAVAGLIGASAPQVAPLSRSRLVGVVVRSLPVARRERAITTTMSYESSVDETVFVFGPVIVGVAAALVSPSAPVVIAAVLTLVFVTAFALHPTAAASLPGGADAVGPAPVAELLRPAVVTVVLGVLGIGLFFGTALTGVTAFMEEAGQGDRTGLLYGFLGLGSAVLALAVMLFPARFTLRWRWLVFGAVMLAGAVAVAVSGSVVAMALALLLAGAGIGPAMVTLYSLGAERSPRGRSATLMTMLGSAVIVGQSAASALNGRLAETHGADAALLGPLVAASVVLLAGAANWSAGRARR